MTLVSRVHAICSTKEILDQEINHLQHVFVTFNGYPKWVVLLVFNKVEIDLSSTSSTKNQQLHTHTHTHTHTQPHTRTHTQTDRQTERQTDRQTGRHKILVLPYKGRQGEHTLKHIKRKINKALPENKNMQLVYTGTNLGTKFIFKDKTKKGCHHDLTYSVKCPMKK